MAEFKPTQTFGIHLQLDQTNRLIKIVKTDEIIPLDQLTDCEYVVQQGKIGRGSIAWSFSATLPGSGVFSATKLAVRLHLQDGTTRDIDLLLTPMKSSNISFKNLDKTAHQICDTLQPLLPQKAAAPSEAEPAYMQELRQLKQLADEGVITQEEFAAKKAQLLGM